MSVNKVDLEQYARNVDSAANRGETFYLNGSEEIHRICYDAVKDSEKSSEPNTQFI